MKDLFVSYQIALELKKLGFNEACLAFYQYDKTLVQKEPFLKCSKKLYYYQNNIGCKESPSLCGDNCIAPLYQQVEDWLYHRYDVIINREFTHFTLIMGKLKQNVYYFATEDDCIIKAIELIK